MPSLLKTFHNFLYSKLFLKNRILKITLLTSLCLSLWGFKNTNQKVAKNQLIVSHLGLVKLQIDNGINDFRTDIYFNTNASLGLDPGYDASLFGGVAPDFSIYTLLVEDNTGVPLGIQALGEYDMNGTDVPLGIHAEAGDVITVNITQNTLPPSVNIYLEDSVEGTLTLLNNSNYQFTAEEDITDTGRFVLKFGADVLNTTDNTLDLLSIFTNKSAKKLVINGSLKLPTEVNIYSINGQLISNNKLDPIQLEQYIDIKTLSGGIYILELSNVSNQKRTEKFIIN